MIETPDTGSSRSAFLSRDRFAGIVLIVVAGLIAWQAMALPLGTWRNPGPAYMPLLTAAVMALMAAVVVWQGGGLPLRAMPWPEVRHAALLIAGCAFAAWALERLGYRLTTMILLVFFLGLLERRHPIAVAAVALALPLGSFFLFSDLLRVPLPRGPWGF